MFLNGCTDASRAVVENFAAGTRLPVAGYEIAFADKSNAWNQYIHALAPDAAAHIFIDGYAAIEPGSLAALAAGLDGAAHASAATGVPSTGRSAAAWTEMAHRCGALHGSLHALRGGFVERIRRAGLRLPIGLYRGDGLVASMVMHDLDPASERDRARIAVVDAATWRGPGYRLADLPRHLRRRVNQARGRLESAAIQRIIYQGGGFAALPPFADLMLAEYLAARPDAQPGWGDIAGRLAVRALSAPRCPAPTHLAARLFVGDPAAALTPPAPAPI